MNNGYFDIKTQEDYEREAKIANERKIASLIKDLREDRPVERQEARYLCTMYLSLQEERMRNYARAREFENAPTIVLMARSAELLEDECRKALDRFSKSHPIGRWLRSIDGIGPVTAAGLLGFIDITMCDVAGRIWAFAGLTPDSVARKGEKIKYNPALKKLCFLIGESFVKVSGKETALYGKIYKERKAYEQAKNEAGDYAEQAAKKLETTRIGKDTDAYKWYAQGKLPPAHIHARARRYAVKIFLSHLHEVWYKFENGKEPPLPFALGVLGHKDKIEPPELTQEMITGKRRKVVEF